MRTLATERSLIANEAALRIELAQARAELEVYRAKEAAEIAGWDAWGDEIEAAQLKEESERRTRHDHQDAATNDAPF